MHSIYPTTNKTMPALFEEGKRFVRKGTKHKKKHTNRRGKSKEGKSLQCTAAHVVAKSITRITTMGKVKCYEEKNPRYALHIENCRTKDR